MSTVRFGIQTVGIDIVRNRSGVTVLAATGQGVKYLGPIPDQRDFAGTTDLREFIRRHEWQRRLARSRIVVIQIGHEPRMTGIAQHPGGRPWRPWVYSRMGEAGGSGGRAQEHRGGWRSV